MRVVYLTAQAFLAEWCTGDEESHPALEVLKRLLKTSDLLSPTVRCVVCLVCLNVCKCVYHSYQLQFKR